MPLEEAAALLDSLVDEGFAGLDVLDEFEQCFVDANTPRAQRDRQIAAELERRLAHAEPDTSEET